MSWFKRIKEGITTTEKKETPEGLWHKCPSCKHIVPSKDHMQKNYVCEQCGYHDRIGSEQYFEILFDNNEFTEINPNLSSDDPLNFVDTKKYTDRIVESQKKAGSLMRSVLQPEPLMEKDWSLHVWISLSLVDPWVPLSVKKLHVPSIIAYNINYLFS